MTTQLQQLLKRVEVAAPMVADRLQVFGLRWTDLPPLDYVTLDEALEREAFEVTEVNEGGSVPTLLVTNKTDSLVFLMAGEQLVGAKQNRVLNASIMVAPKSKTPVPVSCVERGRWGYRSRKFYGSGSSSHAYLRKKMSRDAHEGYRKTGRPTSKQREVWDEVDRMLCKVGSSSPSDALYAAYEDHRQKLDETLKNVSVPDGCCGVVFAFGGRVAGMDLFDKPETLNRLLPKLVRSYALDSLGTSGETAVDRDAVTTWLRTAAEVTFERFESPGVGEDVRMEGEALVGAGLVVETCPVHVELFPEYDDDPGNFARRPRPRPTPPPEATDHRASQPAMRDTSPPPSAAGGVVAFATSESAMAALSRAVALLRSAYGAAGVALSRSGLLVRVAAAEHDRFDASNPVLSHAEEVELVRRVAQRAPHAAQRLVFTGCGLADNWFAHWHRDARTTVVSLYDWQQLSPAPVEAFVGCELVLHGLRALSERYDPGRLLHEQARGCLFDFCQQKAEVNHKLRRASVCVECRAKLTGLNVSVPTVSRMLETVRQMLTAE